MIGRIPVLDVRPAVDCGGRPAKAVVGETFEVSATVFREGHDAVAANVVLRDPGGRPGPWTPMRELAPGTDRWGARGHRRGRGAAGRTPSRPGATRSPPGGTTPAIKIPAGIDTGLVLEEGAELYERAGAGDSQEGRARGTCWPPPRPCATRTGPSPPGSRPR